MNQHTKAYFIEYWKTGHGWQKYAGPLTEAEAFNQFDEIGKDDGQLYRIVEIREITRERK